MNILNLLTQEKRVAGIEISDSVIRIAFFRPRKKARVHPPQDLPEHELILIEEPIGANIIDHGVVVDRVLLSKTLKAIWTKAKLDTQYAIVAIPDDTVYSRIFSFPKSVDGPRLTDAMRLAMNFQLPIKPEESYLDWERIQTATQGLNEILLATIPRTIATGYVEALDKAGIKTLALESHAASIARSIKLEPGVTTLVTEKTPDGTNVLVFRDSVLRFVRNLPIQFTPDAQVATEVQKIKTALESELKEGATRVQTTDLVSSRLQDTYAAYPEFKETDHASKWLVALGAAIRGQIPEGQDALISLLPVGTEEAYSYQKATTFVALIRNMTIGVSLFFIVAFLGAYLFMLSLAQSAERTLSTLSITPVSPELLQKEAWVNHINTLTETGSVILSETPVWSKLVDEVSTRIIPGIIISNFNAPAIEERMTLTGIARDRATLNQFKKTFGESELFTAIELPITNLEQRADIPFSLSFTLKDSSLIYYK